MTECPPPAIQVQVRPAEDFRKPDDMTYRMCSSPKGYALIINNRDFHFESTRYGSERDSKYLSDLFTGLGYEIVTLENLTGYDMRNAIANFAISSCHANSDSCIVSINTHGIGNDILQGTDGELVNLDFDITPMFNNSNCKSLKNKPKLFFIQACRGAKHDEGTDSGKIMGKSQSVVEKIAAERVPSWSDMMIVHSTIPGYVSNRHKCEGSWFVQSLVKTFMEDAWSTDIETMMKKVTSSVMKCKTYEDERQSPEVILRGWTKSLYFNPGLYEEL